MSAVPSFIVPIVRHRHLVFQMVRRDIEMKYRGSLLGPLWVLLTPLSLLAVYTFVFAVVLQNRGGGVEHGCAGFALRLYAGLTVFQLLAGCLNSAPSEIMRNTQFVKRVVFPLDALAWVRMLVAMFDALMNTVVLAVFYVILEGVPPVSVVAVPLIVLPLIPVTLGLMWLLSALGVFLRDLGQFIGTATTLLLFGSAIFYPVDIVPEQWRWVILSNPLAVVIDQVRASLFDGVWPAWWVTGALMALGLLIAWIGHAWFQRVRGAFADVL